MLTIGLLLGVATVLGAGGVAGAVVAGLSLARSDPEGQERAQLRTVATLAGFRAEGALWVQQVEGRRVVLGRSVSGFALRCALDGEAPFSLHTGSGPSDTGDAAFDDRFVLTRSADDPAVWSWLSRPAREAMVRASFHGSVSMERQEVRFAADDLPAVEVLRTLAAEVSRAAAAVGPRSWDDVEAQEPAGVVVRALMVLGEVEPDAAVWMARTVRARAAQGPPALRSEVARVLRDEAAILELLPSQPDERAAARLALALTEEGLVVALGQAASDRGVTRMGGCSMAAVARSARPEVRVAALSALAEWLVQGGLRMPFVEATAVRLLMAGREAVGPEHGPLLARMLQVASDGSLEQVLQVVAARGGVELVPALRALEEGIALESPAGRALARALVDVQSRARGGAGALSLADGRGGRVAVIEEG